LLTVATVSVVVEDEDDEVWLDGLQAASSARSTTMLVKIVVVRAILFIAKFPFSMLQCNKNSRTPNGYKSTGLELATLSARRNSAFQRESGETIS